MCIWKKWKIFKNRRKNFIKFGMDRYIVYKYSYLSKGVVRIVYFWVFMKMIINKRLI
ncbi:hypothetical protein A33I_20975 [Alkalihalophilus marmarensis DSM 21297]|uniref:Uncharacterized protein n=1 Tax=Alkalihalophilus marmarensis DSM 21297 TaxID=1188261 RepID=U6SHB8_9BACI|nr:hypothetical protein A33I_20975 [Alkalihalophilus marmarensis DSM 21297]